MTALAVASGDVALEGGSASALSTSVDAALFRDLRQKADEARAIRNEDVSLEGAAALHRAIEPAEALLQGEGLSEAAVASAISGLDSAISYARGTTALTYQTLNNAEKQNLPTQDEIRAHQGTSRGFDGRIDNQKIGSDLFEVQPNTTKGSYNPGKLSASLQQKLIDLTNGIRFAAGQEDVHLSTKTFSDKTTSSQDGTQAAAFVAALLNSTGGHGFTSKPDGLDQNLFDSANIAAGESLSSYASGRASGSTSYLKGLYDFLWDADGLSGSPQIRHRMTVLSGTLKGTSFGAVKNNLYMDAWTDATCNKWTVEEPNGYIWPAVNTPLEYFNPRTPWTIVYKPGELFPNLGDNASFVQDATITIRSSFGKTWIINDGDVHYGGNLGNDQGYYFTGRRSTDGMSGGKAVEDHIIFVIKDLANGSYKPSPGEVFTVTIDSPSFFGSDKIEYQVNFFELNHSKAELTKLIAEARAYRGLVAASADGADVPAGSSWAPASALSRFDAKVADAEAKVSQAASQENQQYSATMQAAYDDLYGAGGAYAALDAALGGGTGDAPDGPAPAESTVTLAPSSLELVAGGEPATVAVGGEGDGPLSAASSDDAVATASLSGTTLTVAPHAAGTCTISVTRSATDTHGGASADLAVTVRPSAGATQVTVEPPSLTLSYPGEPAKVTATCPEGYMHSSIGIDSLDTVGCDRLTPYDETGPVEFLVTPLAPGTCTIELGFTNYDRTDLVSVSIPVTVVAVGQQEPPEAGTVTIWRAYNPWTGEHLFTTDEGEYFALGGAGWDLEAGAWDAPTSGGEPVWRLYNPWSGDHHYTRDYAEYERMGRDGWRQEGEAFRSPSSGTAVYRLFNPYVERGTHHYTTDWDEYQRLPATGWVQEGVAFRGIG